jgi:hypothetical protein
MHPNIFIENVPPGGDVILVGKPGCQSYLYKDEEGTYHIVTWEGRFARSAQKLLNNMVLATARRHAKEFNIDGKRYLVAINPEFDYVLAAADHNELPQGWLLIQYYHERRDEWRDLRNLNERTKVARVANDLGLFG